MKITIKIDVQSYDFISIETTSVKIESINDSHSYNRLEDAKWIEHARKHGFNPSKDCFNEKIWDQYLLLCAEGLI